MTTNNGSAPLSQMGEYEQGKDGQLNNFIGLFQMYSDLLTDAPLDYSFWSATQLLGHALGYNTQNMIQPGELFHHFYILLVGQSSTNRKTSSQEKAIDVYPTNRMATELTSPESFFEEMSGTPELLIMYDEFSSFLKAATKKGGYQSGFVELFNRLFKPSLKPIIRKLRTSESEHIIDKGYLLSLIHI